MIRCVLRFSYSVSWALGTHIHARRRVGGGESARILSWFTPVLISPSAEHSITHSINQSVFTTTPTSERPALHPRNKSPIALVRRRPTLVSTPQNLSPSPSSYTSRSSFNFRYNHSSSVAPLCSHRFTSAQPQAITPPDCTRRTPIPPFVPFPFFQVFPSSRTHHISVATVVVPSLYTGIGSIPQLVMALFIDPLCMRES